MANETLGGINRLIRGRTGTFTANSTSAVTVNTNFLTVNSAVIITMKTAAGTPVSHPYIFATPVTGVGGSFQTKAGSGDTSVYNYTIID